MTNRVDPQTRRGSSSLLATILLSLTACGPGVIGIGAASIADNDDSDQIIVLVFVNRGPEALAFDLEGVARSGEPVIATGLRVPAGGILRLPIDDPDRIRVRAHEQTESTLRAPATWDFALEQPVDGVECEFDLESAVIAGVLETATEPSAIEVQTLRGTGDQPELRRLDRLDLPVAPRLVRSHPAGGYVYTICDLDEDTLEIRTLRIASESGQIESVASEFGSMTINPRIVSRGGARGEVEFVVEPRGRFAYLLDRDAAARQTSLTVFPIESDGTLGAPGFAQLGFIADLAFRSDGAFAFWIENAAGATFAIQSHRVRDDGTFELVGTEILPCVQDVGGKIQVHPSGRFVYVAFRDDSSDNVKLGAYFVDPFGGLVLIDTQCSDAVTIEDFDFDPAGAFLYLTGTIPDPLLPDPQMSGPVATRVIRYAIDPTTGTLATVVTDQDLGDVTTLTRALDPTRSSVDPLREIVYVAIDSRLVPHVRSAGGALQPLPTGITLPFGSPDTASHIQGVARGCVRITNP